MQRQTLKLLGTSYCHLCEEAESMLKKLLVHDDFQTTILIQKIDVIEDDNLYALYALKIPVLLFSKKDVSLELHWPFCEGDVRNFLIKNLSS